MSQSAEHHRLLSHAVLPDTMVETLEKISTRIKQQGDKSYAKVEYQLDLLNQLSQFDFGRFLLNHRGLNGYWTHYMLTYPWYGKKTGKNNRGEPFTELEKFLLSRAPTLLATQERFEIFLKENQKCVKNNTRLACIPCGMMGELLYLNYEGISAIELVGIDYDANTFKDAEALAEKNFLTNLTRFIQSDAWQLNLKNEFDLISSNGLNIYEPDESKVTELYRQFFQALKPNGKLVTSFLTFPPALTDQCEWNMEKINQKDALLQKIIFIDIIDAKWQCFRSSQQTKDQLIAVGFEQIQFIYDNAKMFPTVIAYKK